MTLIKDPLSPENAEKLEEAAKDVSKAALVHHTAMQQDELILHIPLELLAEFPELSNQHVRRVLRAKDFLLYQFADYRQLLAGSLLLTKILLRDYQCNLLHLQREFS